MKRLAPSITSWFQEGWYWWSECFNLILDCGRGNPLKNYGNCSISTRAIKRTYLTLSETFKSTNDGMILIWVKNPTEGTYQENVEKFPSPQELSKELDYPFNEAFNRNTNDLDLAGIKETL
jgi:hypothetical protein